MTKVSKRKLDKHVLKEMGDYNKKDKLSSFLKPIVQPLSKEDEAEYERIMTEMSRYKCPYCNIPFYNMKWIDDVVILECQKCLYQERFTDQYSNSQLEKLYDLIAKMNGGNAMNYGGYILSSDGRGIRECM